MGLFWCVVQGLTRGAMYSGQKVAQNVTHVKLANIILIRSFIIILGAYIYGKRDGVDFSPSSFMNLPSRIKNSIFWRSFYGYGAIVAAMAAIQLTPVSISVSIMMTQVFVSAIVGFLLANETLTSSEILSIIGGFTGVLLLVNDNIFAR